MSEKRSCSPGVQEEMLQEEQAKQSMDIIQAPNAGLPDPGMQGRDFLNQE